jgi:hypothetical protein
MEQRVVMLEANFETGGLVVRGPYGTRIEFQRDELQATKSADALKRWLEPRMKMIERLLNIPTGKRK